MKIPSTQSNAADFLFPSSVTVQPTTEHLAASALATKSATLITRSNVLQKETSTWIQAKI